MGVFKIISGSVFKIDIASFMNHSNYCLSDLVFAWKGSVDIPGVWMSLCAIQDPQHRHSTGSKCKLLHTAPPMCLRPHLERPPTCCISIEINKCSLHCYLEQHRCTVLSLKMCSEPKRQTFVMRPLPVLKGLVSATVMH